MQNERASRFAETVHKAAMKVGNSAPKIADRIMPQAFPQTSHSAADEGAFKMLRVGVISAIKNILKNGATDEENLDFASIDPSFGEIVGTLKSKTYYVESTDEYVAVPRLIAEPALLDDARKFMRRKGVENLAEAERLDQLYVAVTGAAVS